MLLSLLSAVLASAICSLLLAVSVVYGLSAVCCACVLAVWACELAVCPGISNTSIGIFFRGPSGPTLLAASNITGQNITYSTLLLTSNVHPCYLTIERCSAFLEFELGFMSRTDSFIRF